MASVLGTAGYGIVSQILTYNNFITLFCLIGIPTGIIRYVSVWEKDGLYDNIRTAFRLTLILSLIISVLVLFANIIFSYNLSILLYGTGQYTQILILYSFSIPFSIVAIILDAFLRGFKKFNFYVKATVFSSIFNLLFAIILVYFLNIRGVLVYMICSGVVSTIFFMIFINKLKFISVKDFFLSNALAIPLLKKILLIGIGALAIGLSDSVVALIIRSIIIKNFSLSDNGLYQSVISISSNYLSIILMTASIYSIPILSELKDRELINLEINNTLRISLLFIVPIILLAFTFREYVLIIFFSKEFLAAENLFFFNFLGDFVRILAAIFGLWLVPQSKIKAWSFFNLLYSLNYLILIELFLNYSTLNLNSFTLAYLLANLIHLALNYLYFRNQNNFIFKKENIVLILCSSLSLILLFLVSNQNKTFGYFLVFPLLLIWALISYKKSELANLKKLMLDKIKK